MRALGVLSLLLTGCVIADDDLADAAVCEPGLPGCPPVGGRRDGGGRDGGGSVDGSAPGSCAEACGRLGECAATTGICASLGPADEARISTRCGRFCDVQPAFADRVAEVEVCAAVVDVGRDAIQWFNGMCPR